MAQVRRLLEVPTTVTATNILCHGYPIPPARFSTRSPGSRSPTDCQPRSTGVARTHLPRREAPCRSRPLQHAPCIPPFLLLSPPRIYPPPHPTPPAWASPAVTWTSPTSNLACHSTRPPHSHRGLPRMKTHSCCANAGAGWCGRETR